MVIKFNRLEDGRFWLSNFEMDHPFDSPLPLEIDEQGRAIESSGYFDYKGLVASDNPINARVRSAEHLFQALKFAWIDPNLGNDTDNNIRV